MATFTELVDSGVPVGDAAAQMMRESSWQSGLYARARVAVADRLAGIYAGEFDPDLIGAAAMFEAMLRGFDTAEGLGISAEELAANAGAYAQAALLDEDLVPGDVQESA